MKQTIKISLLLIFIVLTFIGNVYGFEINQLDGSGGNVVHLEKVGADILSIISIIGSAISIIAMIILGIKYMLGSVEEKAEYKKTLLPYLIGAICVFGATVIPGFVYDLFN